MTHDCNKNERTVHVYNDSCGDPKHNDPPRHTCENEIESNMARAHCRRCEKDMTDTPTNKRVEEFYQHMLKSTPVLDEFERASLKSKVEELLTEAYEQGRKAKGSSWREGYARGRADMAEEMREAVEGKRAAYYDKYGEAGSCCEAFAGDELCDILIAITAIAEKPPITSAERDKTQP